ncbi:MAG: ribosome recycling factor [Buchnera aphidicola (Periphyllus lyropictus)]|uniref:ribosome recycling factor n=1 Tax=Buchnera aphidicola TaxID=9 RepID=UPI001EB3CFF2|nr:ribosome recycling factor [Buchnera aphidicola]NIH16637.1 ribosome recycling factor [Buchnera aphidicola (Periphyllus lyropictus)]USS94547.1 ribosome recycling factor [Buchnera aphidicola (Periphyllus lyropictus)]
MIKNIIEKTKKKMKICVNNFILSINRLRTGRASPDLLKDLPVEYYNKKVSLGTISNITIEDSRTLRVHSFDKNSNKNIEKSIISSNLGLNPIISDEIIRVPIPQLTEERRKNLIKIVHESSEKSKICIRLVRRKANDEVKKISKDINIGKNEKKKHKYDIQLLTNSYIKKIDSLLQLKKKELLNF